MTEKTDFYDVKTTGICLRKLQARKEIYFTGVFLNFGSVTVSDILVAK